MDKTRKAIVMAMALLGAVALMALLTACGDDSSSSTTGGDNTEIRAGGTLRLGMTVDPGLDVFQPYTMQQHHWCCLNRTLYSYSLTPVDERGGNALPDLADGQPEASDDGLTYTVKLKRGLKYAPPYADREIVAEDVIRTLRIMADPRIETTSAGNYTIFKGIDQNTGKLSEDEEFGVTAPDDYTLVFRLKTRKGDFLHILAWPSLTPLPDGAFDGHERDFGRYLVSSGPYMVEGSDRLDPANPKPLSGYVPGRALTLVRNPSWERSTDDLRMAYPDRMEFTFGDQATSIAQKVTAGELDVMFNDQAPPETIQQYRNNPDLRDRLHINPKVSLRLVTINAAVAPFDDIHVRRAANLIINREDIQRVNGGPEAGTPAYHRFPPTVMQGFLDDYAPYETATPEEALEKAMEEMRQSKYDPGRTGRCTVAACERIRAVPTRPDSPDTNVVRQDLAKIGLDLGIETYSAESAFGKCNDPANRIALCIGLNFGAAAPDPGGPATDLLSRNVGPDGCCNLALAGLSGEQLRELGYSPDIAVPPSLDDEILACDPLEGDERFQCYADVDERATELALAIPLLFPQQREIVGERVTNYTHDFYGYMSLNQVALTDGT